MTIDTATASTTNLMDEAEHEFRFVTAVVEGKYQVQLYLDGKLQATVLYENCPMQTAEQLYFFFRQTGGNGSITITEFKISAVEDLEVKTLMSEIFALPHKITADNLSDVKAQIAVLEGKYDALGTADQEKVENIGYVDFVKYGEAFGVAGEHVDTPEALAAAVEKAMQLDAPYIIEVALDPKNMVQPMVTPGLGIGDFVKFKEQ